MQLSLVFSFDPDEEEPAERTAEAVPLEPLPRPLVDQEEPALDFRRERRGEIARSALRNGPV
jgi:hypothetical protein